MIQVKNINIKDIQPKIYYGFNCPYCNNFSIACDDMNKLQNFVVCEICGESSQINRDV